VVELTVLAHGRTPVEGGAPKVVVTKLGGRVRRTLDAEPTRRPGVYLARVVFPSPGWWRYTVYDNYAGARHTFAPVRIGEGGRAIRAAQPTARGRPAPVTEGEPSIAAASAWREPPDCSRRCWRQWSSAVAGDEHQSSPGRTARGGAAGRRSRFHDRGPRDRQRH
jgi:hypothetical protein